ncbi:MAG TPA: decarboxylating 6-phosphogluconate dehydrogenase [Acidimicrobiales bacterium]|nr:decarboxylating 6-phosphogluconate dehydrogenase [Acidimicrobiales bacterium]
MQLAMVGLGRMGASMARRLVARGHDVVVYDLDPARAEAEAEGGATPVTSLEDLVAKLEAPRAVWVMVPSGEATRTTLAKLAAVLESGDTVVDGGNSNYHDSKRVWEDLAQQGIQFIDAGVSGGVWGEKNGYCLMVGGDDDAVRRLEPAFMDLATADGYAHVGPAGAGHYTKMVHNGIEYGLLQAYAEGFALLEAATELELDLHQLAVLWNHGSVVRSWLLELAEAALADPKEFASIRGYVEDSGEGRWTVEEAVNRAVPAPVITASLFERFSSRDDERFGARVIAALRNQFGGHRLHTATSDPASTTEASNDVASNEDASGAGS